MPLNNRSVIKGTYCPPGDKSISHRILILTGQAIGKSKILDDWELWNDVKLLLFLG